MNLQETLFKLFGVKVKKENYLTNWHVKDLKKFTDEELKQLEQTCRDLGTDTKKALAKTIRTRIVVEKLKRNREKRVPTINLKKNKGKKK